MKETKVTPTDTGKTMIEMVLVVDGGPYDDEYLWNNLVFPNHESKPGHRRMFLRSLRALGFSEAFLRDNNPTPEDLARLMVGRSVVANVSHRNWEGDDRTEVKSLHPPGGEDEVPPAPAFAGTDTATFLRRHRYHCTPTMQVQMFLCRCQRRSQRKRKHHQSRN